MKQLMRKSKLILFGLVMFFLGYFTINYIENSAYAVKGISDTYYSKQDIENQQQNIVRNFRIFKPVHLISNAESKVNNNKSSFIVPFIATQALNRTSLDQDLKKSARAFINNESIVQMKAKNSQSTTENETNARTTSTIMINININELRPTEISENNEPIDELPNNETSGEAKRRLLAYDGGGFGSVSTGLLKCSKSLEVEVTGLLERLTRADFSFFHMKAPVKESIPATIKKPHYTMVFTMESEPHSFGGDTWSNVDFRMFYHLDRSFPEPATYFDVKKHLLDLLSPEYVSFDQKLANGASMAWIVSNCNAYNARERFMKELMREIRVDSYGACLKNKYTHTSEHMKGNIDLFKKYKFVISIENSNCEDYVTEKLVHTVASGSVPIVAGKNGKPDYARFMPKGSYINIYDFKSIKQLADHVKKIAADRNEYEKFIWFKRGHNRTREQLASMSLDEIIAFAKTVFDPNEKFFSELVLKEKSEDKLCKIARYLHTTPKDVVDNQIKMRKENRHDIEVACLKPKNLAKDFDLKAFETI
jgi:hypothetical protein